MNCCRAAKVRVCADGGANRLFDNMPELCIDEHDVSVIRERFVCFLFHVVVKLFSAFKLSDVMLLRMSCAIVCLICFLPKS